MKNARVATDNAGGQLSCGGHVADGRPREAIWSGWGGGWGLPSLLSLPQGGLPGAASATSRGARQVPADR